MRTVYADAETAGIVQSAIDKAGLGDQLKVECSMRVPPGMILAGEQLTPLFDVQYCIAGARILLPVADLYPAPTAPAWPQARL